MNELASQKITPGKFNQWVLKFILNLWSILALILIVADFLSQGRIDSTASAAGIIYVALLGIYVGQKEYMRWRTPFISRHLGEAFIILWTAVISIMAVTAAVSGGIYRVPENLAVVYSSVIGIFAISRQSRYLSHKKIK